MSKRPVRLWLAFVAISLLGDPGCGPPLENALLTPEGVPARLEGISAILNNDDLTEEGKRDSLIAIGITDEDLLDFLLAQ